MLMSFSGVMRFFVSTVWTLFVTLVFIVAAYIALGKVLAPSLADYKQDIEEILSNQLQQPVSIKHLQAKWQGFSPIFSAHEVAIGGDFSIQKMQFQPAVVESIFKRQWIMSQIDIAGLSLHLLQQSDGWFLSTSQLTNNKSNSNSGLSLSQVDHFLKQQHRTKLSNIEIKLSPIDQSPFDIVLQSVDISTSIERAWLIMHSSLHRQGQTIDLQLQAERIFGQSISVYVQHAPSELAAWATLLPNSPWQINSLIAEGQHWLQFDDSGLSEWSTQFEIDRLQVEDTQFDHSIAVEQLCR